MDIQGQTKTTISSEKNPNATKLLDTPTEVTKVHDNLEILKTQDTDTKDADKTEENDIHNVDNSAITQVKLPDSHTKPSVSLGEDRDGSHKDNFIDTFELSDNKDQAEEVYVLSVSSDITLVDHADTLIDDFKDHKTIYSSVPHDDKDTENRSIVYSFEVKTAEENIEESQTSENSESVPEHTNLDLSAIVPTVFAEEAKVVKTQPSEMSETVPESTDNLCEPKASSDKRSVATLGEKIETEGGREEINRETFESHNKHAQEVIKKSEIDRSGPVLTEAYTTVKEPGSGIEDKRKIVEGVVANSKDSGDVASSERLEKVEEPHDASGVVCETVVDESIGSSSRNSVEGNWGSVSVLSTASVDAENAHTIGKSDIYVDKSRLGKSYAFEDPALVESKDEIVDQKTSEIKAVTVQNSQPSKPEANVSNETDGRKRNEEAIAKVTNWSTGEHPAAPLKNLVSEAKSSNPKQLSTMIQKDETAEKISDPEKSNLTPGTPPRNQDPSPPKYIGEGKKVGKKTKGRASWVPFVCCSSVNVK